MALIKTYLLAPDFTFRLDGPIALGNIIADPSKPHQILTKPDPDEPTPEIESAVEYDYTVGQGAGHGVSMGLWTQFLQIVGGNIGIEHGKGTNNEYSMSALRTVYFKNDPSEEDLRERASVPRVRNAMQYDSVWSRPVYMVTGLMIAEGFTASTEAALSRAGSIGTSMRVIPEVPVGAEFGLSQETSQKDSFRSGNDIIFAYQVLEIAPEGLGNLPDAEFEQLVEACCDQSGQTLSFPDDSSYTASESLPEQAEHSAIMATNPGFPFEFYIARPTRSGSFHCEPCGGNFTNKSNLARHQDRFGCGPGTGKKFTCDQCGERFKRSDKLKDHSIRTHSKGASSAQ